VNRIRVRPPGEEERYEFWLDWHERFQAEQDAFVEIPTTRTGAVRLRFEHEFLGEGSIDLNVDRPLVEVGPEAFPEPGTLVVQGAGEGPINVEVYDEVYGWRFVGWEQRHLPTATRTDWRIGTGAYLRITGEERVPVYRTLRSKSPFTLSLGDATLDIGGALVACCIDGSPVMSEARSIHIEGAELTDAGRLVVRGLDAGPHLLLISSTSGAKAMRVVLEPGEHRRLEFD
jgi:hypothetical protein